MKFILDVEDVLLELVRGDRRRLVILIWLPIVFYGVMAMEVWAVFWAIGEPIGLMEGLTIETFARLGSGEMKRDKVVSAESEALAIFARPRGGQLKVACIFKTSAAVGVHGQTARMAARDHRLTV